MKQDIFYQAKLKSYTSKFLDVEFSLSESHEYAEKKLELEYDSRGRYLGPSSEPFYGLF